MIIAVETNLIASIFTDYMNNIPDIPDAMDIGTKNDKFGKQRKIKGEI
jgi:hypothetical protein